MRARVLAARALLVDGATLLCDAGLLLEGGHVRRVLASRSAVRRAARVAELVELGDALLTQGLVNAHVHLELSGLAGRLPRRSPFGAWIGELLERRAARGARALAADARRGAARAVRRGTTLAGDVDTTGGSERGLVAQALRVRLFREVLDAQDPGRTEDALRRVRRALPRRARRCEGLAPHAPYSASPALLAALGRLARRRGLPVSVHWAETEAETRWLRDGTGSLAALLGPSPRRAGLDLLEEAGLLGPSLLLVHGNWPAPGEPARIAASGATLVHCPGSHAWFERARFPLSRFLRAGVRVALGTDSLASNEDLDLAREMALLRREQPWLAPAEVWRMATEAGARALGFEGLAGSLRPGAFADLVAWDCTPNALAAAHELLTTASAPVAHVWIGGRDAFPARRAIARIDPIEPRSAPRSRARYGLPPSGAPGIRRP